MKPTPILRFDSGFHSRKHTPQDRLPSETSAFSLTELFVVVAMLGLLLVSALAQPKSRATQTSCVNNLRQVGQAIQMFADEHSDYLPPGGSSGLWIGQNRVYRSTGTNDLCYHLAIYMGEPPPSPGASGEVKAFACPARERELKPDGSASQVVFALNSGSPDLTFQPFGYPSPSGFPQMPSHRLAEIQAQKPLAQVWSVIDADQWAYPTASWGAGLPRKPVHGQIRNALYFDGHVAPRTVGASGTH